MIAQVSSIALKGLEPYPVNVEVDTRMGLSRLVIVGLAETSIKESEQRVKSAIKNSGFKYWQSWVTVNLAPSDLRKEGTIFDVPIAVGLLLASKQFEAVETILRDSYFIGELALDGKIRHVQGILPLVVGVKRIGGKRVFVPHADILEATLIRDIEVVGVKSLNELVGMLSGMDPITPAVVKKRKTTAKKFAVDLTDIRGQSQAKRVLEICAAGGHNVLFIGPPGSGKTMLARAMQTLLPPLSEEESLEVTTLYSLAGLLPRTNPLLTDRPFRSPHHTASSVSIIGGGRLPRPGELSLAHRGILFLDELPEFPKVTLEVLRQPLEEGTVSISRAQMTVSYPAQVMLVAAMNPCPCGFSTDPQEECTCRSVSILNYRQRISGPLLDRIDVYIEVPRVPIETLQESEESESSTVVKKRVSKARTIQMRRLGAQRTNSMMNGVEMDRYCVLELATKQFLSAAATRMHLSARGYHRVLKLARTIADLEGKKLIQLEHVAEAIQYRSKLS